MIARVSGLSIGVATAEGPRGNAAGKDQKQSRPIRRLVVAKKNKVLVVVAQKQKLLAIIIATIIKSIDEGTKILGTVDASHQSAQ